MCVKLYRSQKVCKQGSTLGLWKWSRQMLQTRNCLSICRTTGLVLPVSRLAMVTDIHRHSWGPGHTLTCYIHTQAWLFIHKSHYNYSIKWSMSLEGSLLTWIVSIATLTALNQSLEPLFSDSIFSKTKKKKTHLIKTIKSVVLTTSEVKITPMHFLPNFFNNTSFVPCSVP